MNMILGRQGENEGRGMGVVSLHEIIFHLLTPVIFLKTIGKRSIAKVMGLMAGRTSIHRMNIIMNSSERGQQPGGIYGIQVIQTNKSFLFQDH